MVIFYLLFLYGLFLLQVFSQVKGNRNDDYKTLRNICICRVYAEELEAIAACTIGGVSANGGVGRVGGILVGVLVFEI